jgi:cardiolipin synthase
LPEAAPLPAPTAEDQRGAADNRALQPGHRVQLLKGGTAYFEALVSACDGALVEVLLETYIFEFEGASIAVAETLERAARRGVTVRVVIDGIGSSPVPAEWQARWQSAGVEWRVFNPARGWRVLLPARWRRLHRKLSVIDGRICFCGGINVLDDYYDPTHGKLAQPRFDFAVRVTGPLVVDAHETMTRLWLRMQAAHDARHFDFAAALEGVRKAAAVGTDADDPELTAPDLSGGREGRPPLAGLVLRDNFRFRKRIEHFYRHAIGQARSEILIANAYFVPGVALQRGLLRAAKRGVKVTLLLQGRYEYFMQHHTSRAMYGVMLDAGIEIIEYAPSFLHAKVAVFDSEQGSVATVGSSNLDPFSLLLAREANVFVRDERFAAELRGHLLDAAKSGGKRVEKAAYSKRPLIQRSLAWVAYAAMRIALFATRHRY